MLSIPRIPTGRTTLSWRYEAEGGLYYYVEAPGGQPARLNPGMLLIGLLADGTSNLRDIYERLQRTGLQVDDPAVVVMTFRRLDQAGAVDMQWHYETLGEIRHECVGCGRSCEGHLIGPLSDAEVERLVELRAKLVDLEPDLVEAAPVMLFETGEGRRPALNTSSGRCVFLDAKSQCALHKHFGSHSKPLKCQLFPLRVIETEEGFRVGISSRCAMAHQTFRSAAATTPAQELAARRLRRPPGDLVTLDPLSPRSLRATPGALRNQLQEQFYLDLLGLPGVSLTEVIAAGGAEHRPGAGLPDDYLRGVAALLRRFAGRYECDPLNRPGTAYGDGVRAFLADLRELPEAPGWREPPTPTADYLLHSLRQLVFLRETAAFGTVEIGVQVGVIGVLGALWAARPSSIENGRPSDRLAQYLSYWLRLHNGGRAMPALFDTPDELTELGRRLAVRA